MGREAREKLEKDHPQAIHVRRGGENTRLLVLGVDVTGPLSVVGFSITFEAFRERCEDKSTNRIYVNTSIAHEERPIELLLSINQLRPRYARPIVYRNVPFKARTPPVPQEAFFENAALCSL